MSWSPSLIRLLRAVPAPSRAFSTSKIRLSQNQSHDAAVSWRKAQTEKPLNPHMTNTNSTIANEMPSVGRDAAPPEMITSVDPDSRPADSIPENTKRMLGGRTDGGTSTGYESELAVGEMEGGSFKVEPIRRSNEDSRTIRARLLCSLNDS